jgi:hypothetical protein
VTGRRHQQPGPDDRQGPSIPRGLSCVRRPPAHPEQQAGGAEGGPGGDPPPGILATAIAPRLVVQPGRDARRSSANVRHPAAAQVQTAGPFALDGLPGATPAGHPRWSVVGRAFGACCFAGKLRSPAPPTGRWPHPARLQGGESYVNPYVNLYGIPCATDGVPHLSPRARICPGHAPEGGQSAAKTAADWPPSGEWSGRAERCASRD